MKILAHSENAFSASLLMATSLLISPASSASLLLTCNKANTSSKEPIVTPPLPCTLYLRLCGRASALVRQQHLKNYRWEACLPRGITYHTLYDGAGQVVVHGWQRLCSSAEASGCCTVRLPRAAAVNSPLLNLSSSYTVYSIANLNAQLNNKFAKLLEKWCSGSAECQPQHVLPWLYCTVQHNSCDPKTHPLPNPSLP